MKIIESIKKRINAENEAEQYKREAEHYKREYKRELLRNQAYSHAILQAALSGKLTTEQQRLLYDLVDNEMNIIYKKLL